MFKKKKPKRLYYPVKSRWYSKPRKRRKVKSNRKHFSIHWLGFFKNRINLMVTLGTLLFLVGILFSSSYFVIKNIEVARENFHVDSSAIEKILNPYIGKNILISPTSRIQKTIQKSFPEFVSVHVQKILPSTLKINLETFPPVANLRAYYTLPEPENKEENAALPPLFDEDIAKQAFDLENQNASPTSGPEVIEQKSLLNRIGQAIFDQEENLELITITLHGLSQPIENRQQVITKEHMDFLSETIAYFTATFDMEVSGAQYLPAAREFHLHIKNGPTFWLTIEKDYKQQIDKLKTIYEPAELHKEDLSYIDLRIREKVIYCPKSAPCNR